VQVYKIITNQVTLKNTMSLIDPRFVLPFLIILTLKQDLIVCFVFIDLIKEGKICDITPVYIYHKT